jgi:hypothetical protein
VLELGTVILVDRDGYRRLHRHFAAELAKHHDVARGVEVEVEDHRGFILLRGLYGGANGVLGVGVGRGDGVAALACGIQDLFHGDEHTNPSDI